MMRSHVRRLAILTSLTTCLLIVPRASGKPLKPKVNEPDTYGAAMFGINEDKMKTDQSCNLDKGGESPANEAAQHRLFLAKHVLDGVFVHEGASFLDISNRVFGRKVNSQWLSRRTGWTLDRVLNLW